MAVWFSPSVALILSLFLAIVVCSYSYQRPQPRDLVYTPEAEDADGTSPQQVHISLVGTNNMRVSWITNKDAPATVEYGTSPGKYSFSANGNTTSYSYLIYKSGQIHDVVIGPLNPDTVYYYRCSGSSSKEFSFKSPPSDLPIKFVVVGDLGQTGWTQKTLDHIAAVPYDMLLLPGDLSYADYIQSLWDSFGRLVEPLASARPWMVTQGNHEVEKIPLVHPKSFVAYNSRWPMPFSLSSSPSNLFYSFDVASSVHVIMLGSYADYGTDSDQYKWLKSDLAKINRNKTPWLIALIHAPWYNTNKAHQKEGEDMRQAMETLLYGARVDVVFAGHVHAYERFTGIYNQKMDPRGPVHITIGDGGNKEGLAKNYQDPPPAISLFREASFGHGRFDVVNATHALWAWHRNDDDVAVIADQVHISLVGTNNMRVSWITNKDAPATVEYGTSPGKYSFSANGNTTSYSYLTYKSGQIHDVVIGPLNPDTVYYYRCSGSSSKEFSFKSPPSDLPIKFVVVGDLGQTGWTQKTLDHIAAMPYDMLLLPGDLSYADYIQSLWDSFGRLVEPLASARPWMVTQGNHEVEKIPLVHPKSFVAYNSRWPMPFSLSSSPSNLFYSFDVASSVHVIMLGSYADYGTDSDQYKWLQSDLAKIDRNKTPWLIALIHAPWYNTNEAHQKEGEDMRQAMETLLYGARVDVVFAGHVHAYERFTGIYNQKMDPRGPVHITIGDGGNKEGLAKNYQDPPPAISLFREASFGHGRFDVVNATHALWAWHRNDDDVAVIADQVWITSHSSDPTY